jgi:hypothetical protein
LKLKFDETLSDVASDFSLRRYTAARGVLVAAGMQPRQASVSALVVGLEPQQAEARASGPQEVKVAAGGESFELCREVAV